MTERKAYLDTCKGLLMLLVIYGHIVYAIGLYSHGLSNNTYDYIQKVASYVVAPFYMAAFFVVTGMCSNFDKPLTGVLFSGLRKLIVPGIVITLFMSLLHFNDFELFSFFKSVVIRGGGQWFVVAMFVARLMYWGINKLSTMLRLGICMILCCTGVCFYGGGKYEMWYIWHAMVMMVFFEVGRSLPISKLTKQHSWLVLIALYLVIIMLLHYSHHVVPAFCATQNFSWKYIPVFLLLCTLGSYAMIGFSKQIGSNMVLEFIGRNSLVYYLTHFTFFTLVIPRMKDCISDHIDSAFLSLGIVTFLLVGSTIWSTLWVFILNRRWAKWVIGK